MKAQNSCSQHHKFCSPQHHRRNPQHHRRTPHNHRTGPPSHHTDAILFRASFHHSYNNHSSNNHSYNNHSYNNHSSNNGCYSVNDPCTAVHISSTGLLQRSCHFKHVTSLKPNSHAKCNLPL
ncbi:hypothetical protein COCOBI_18-0380 [Coccomyxa sp. Obi]|nr:hypothetical protein COCOBI_18-0380 [Coccomyxa sp. Obi]